MNRAGKPARRGHLPTRTRQLTSQALGRGIALPKRARAIVSGCSLSSAFLVVYPLESAEFNLDFQPNLSVNASWVGMLKALSVQLFQVDALALLSPAAQSTCRFSEEREEASDARRHPRRR